jgi:DNA-binding XRE family transcriptional regulator
MNNLLALLWYNNTQRLSPSGGSTLSRGYFMRLEDFRIEVAVLTRQDLATVADVSISSIQRAEEGKGVNRLTQSRILKGLSKHLGRTVTREEIDEFRN